VFFEKGCSMSADPQVIRSERHSRIGALLQQDAPIIIARWQQKAEEEQPQARRVHSGVLVDHMSALLHALGRSLSESSPESISAHHRPAKDHGLQRWETGWSVAEVVRDYQILRLTIIDHLETALKRQLNTREIMAIGLALDEAISSSVNCYVKHLEAAAQQAEKERARRDEHTATLLRQQTAILQEANHRKDEFLAVLGHELRNPLAPVRNAIHVLQLKGQEAETREWVSEMLERQVTMMTHLVDQLLDASRIGRGKILIERGRLDLARLLLTVAGDQRPALENAGLRFQLDVAEDPVWVEGDPTRLAQVITNLLGNAGKFTDRGGQVNLKLETDQQTRRAVVKVRDTGIGIDPETLPHVFESFQQGKSDLERNRGGLGLGLALVKGLVELHGGQVEAGSAGPGKGAEFCLWLPLSGAKKT
jgi:signal transduction histidine kinase